jgi:toxin CcdB
MPQFDLYKNPRGGAYALLLDVQSDVLSRLATRAVVPLISLKRYGSKPISRLNPVVKIAGVEHVLLVQELSAVPVSALAVKQGSLAARRADIIAALDLLFTGL